MLNCKYSEKVWKYLNQSELWIYFLIFSLSGFWIWNFAIFPGSAIIGLDLGYFQNFLTFLNQAFKTLKFFHSGPTWVELWKFFGSFSNPVDLNWTLKIFWKFFNFVWFKLDFENFFNLFKPELIVWTLNFFLNMYTHMIELAYNCWTLLTLTNPTVLYLVDIPPSKVWTFNQNFFKIFYHTVTW